MDKDIRVLEKIGLHEVCKKTHIEVQQLQYMINGEYEKLNKINTLGFVKILSREYKIDFTDWLEGFHDYWAEHKSEEELGKDKIFVRAKSDKAPKKMAILFLLLFLLAGIFGILSIFKIEVDVVEMFDKVKTQTISNNSTIVAFQNPPVVAEAASSMGVKVEERIVETNSSNATVEAVVVKVENNQTLFTDSNSSNQTIPSTSLAIESQPLVNNVPANQALIVPKRKIWIGTVYLDEGKRKESTSDTNLTIDLTKRQIIKTGNGYFKLSYDGSVEDFTEQGSTRFLVENGTLKKISEEVFVQLNKGKNW